MELIDWLIVGSGPAGVSAARKLGAGSTKIIDVGEHSQKEFSHESLDDALDAGDTEALLGASWETLANIINPKRFHPKLRNAGSRYVLKGERLKIVDAQGKAALLSRGSYAQGGMSVAWGGQLLRYTQTDLDEVGAWPIKANQLAEYYSDLERHIGISGKNDDMSEFLGHSQNLLPAVSVTSSSEELLERYRSRRGRLKKMGISIGRARLAVLTKSYRNYPKYNFGDKEFYSTNSDGLYSAKRTLDEMIAEGAVEYLPGRKLLAYRELSDFVEIDVALCGTSEIVTMRARNLFLACGTVHTSKIVLENENFAKKSLPFIDHPPTLLPLFLPTAFGKNLHKRSYPIQLVGASEHQGRRAFMSFYQPSSLLWTDMLYDIPLPVSTSRELLKYILPGMFVAQIWQPANSAAENQFSIEDDGSVRIDYGNRESYSGLKHLLSGLRKIGVYSSRRLASPPEPGWGFHYAGTLPMRKTPSILETHPDGRLWNSRRIRVIDGSVLPSLPAKNHSLTIMANAARIAEKAKTCGY